MMENLHDTDQLFKDTVELDALLTGQVRQQFENGQLFNGKRFECLPADPELAFQELLHRERESIEQARIRTNEIIGGSNG